MGPWTDRPLIDSEIVSRQIWRSLAVARAFDVLPSLVPRIAGIFHSRQSLETAFGVGGGNGGVGATEVRTAPRSPWQNPYAERLIGSIRRELLDHVLVLGEGHLHRLLTDYFEYYELSRTHLSLDKDAHDAREVQPPAVGEVVELPRVGGLHHRYECRAA